jgi:hypothetical protein
MSFFKCITTSKTQKEHIEKVMRRVSFEIISPIISEAFEKPELPPKTIISIHSRDQRDTANIIKQFYVKFPQYRWITFRDMRGLTEKEFANNLKDSFLSVWVDPTSAFGTYPLESMKMGIPVIGQLPHLQPEWLNENKEQVVFYGKLNSLDKILTFAGNTEIGIQALEGKKRLLTQ